MRKPKKKRTRCACCQRRKVCTYERLFNDDDEFVGMGWACSTCEWN